MSVGRIKTPFGLWLPRRVRIGATWYTVSNERLPNELQIGECSPLSKRIIIDVAKITEPTDCRVAFRHETTHGMVAEYALDISHDDVHRLAHGTVQVDEAWEAAQKPR